MRIRINIVLFFSSGGKAFREKVWKLPEATTTAKGRALINLLPELGKDEITTVLPLPQDESLWENLHLVFATASGDVRRNKLADFKNVRAAGLIAMKLDEGDRLIGVATCRDGDDVFLATKLGRCIRFQITDENLRVFSGRDSAGVRGIKLGAEDEVMSLSVLRHVDATPEERAAYLKYAVAQRRNGDEEAVEHGRIGRGGRRMRSAGSANRGTGGGGGDYPHRHRFRASANVPRPMNIASPAVAGRALPISP